VIILLVLIVIGFVLGVGLCIEMSRRDETLLGVAALGVLMAASVLGAVYAALAAD
jgi:hypothetical protein